MMHTYISHLLAFGLGGITFVPLLLLAFLLHAYFTLPVQNLQDSRGSVEDLDLTENEKDTSDQELQGLPQDFKLRSHEPDVAATYFAVCREYDSGQSLGKATDRNQSASSSTTTLESPSVYQTMYRSIFERGKTQTPSINSGAKTSKKTRNVFFIVIRLGLLMLYDDSEQLEVRHVMSLANYDIDIWGGGEVIPEGELFVKRNCIRMVLKSKDDSTAESKPFYLFTTNCSEKEDFYYAMLQNQGRDTSQPLSVLRFNDDDMVKLIRQLHASQDNFQTRWINALLGRVFLSMYKTAIFEQYVRKKINKKLSRVVKPAFISAIQIRDINLGDSAPFFTGPKLKELTRDGDLTLESDVKYKGNARIDVAAVAKIDLGPRFKVREVQLVLAVICKSLEGHMFFRVKPPPSNRIWFTFETMPKLDLSIEPVVSSRQITYSLILRAIDSRLREVIGETLVHPNWDDVPFFDTTDRSIRSGLWEFDSAEALDASVAAEPLPAEGGTSTQMQEDENPAESEERLLAEEAIETVAETANGSVMNRKKKRANSSKIDPVSETGAWSSGADNIGSPSPRPIRSQSFAAAAVPVVSHDQAVVETRDGIRSGQPDAATGLKDIRSRSQSNTPTESPVGSPSGPGILAKPKGRSLSSASKLSGTDSDIMSPKSLTSILKDVVDSSQAETDDSSVRSESSASTRMTPNKRQTIVSTAAAARRWGLDFVARHAPHSSTSSISSARTDLDDSIDSESLNKSRSPTSKSSREMLGSKTNPIGRGQPLPPPGQPLPGPRNNRMIWAAPLTMLGRKGSGMDGKTANSSTLSVISSNSTPLDPNNNPSGQEPQLPHGPVPLQDGDFSAGDMTTTTAILHPSRKDSSSGSSRRASTPLTNEDVPDDSLLVIKAPEQDNDMDSYDGSAADDMEESSEPPGIFTMSESPIKEAPIVSEMAETTENTDEFGSDSQTPPAMATLSQEEQPMPHKYDEIEEYVIPKPSSSIHQMAISSSPPPLPPTPLQRQTSRSSLPRTPSSSIPISVLRRTTDSSLATPSSPVVDERFVSTFPASASSSPPEMIPSPPSSNGSSSALAETSIDGTSNLSLNGHASRIPRKSRSRQSLIPTPTHPVGSRRSSPGASVNESRRSSGD